MSDNFSITLYNSSARQNARITSYPHRRDITTLGELKNALRHDYVCGQFADDVDTETGELRMKAKRTRSGFLRSDCVALDFDNDHTDDPAGWITPEIIRERLPGVAFAARPPGTT